MSLPLETIQKILQEEALPGWLLFDFHERNPFMHEILKIPKGRHITRRVFYWIPSSGEPIKIVSRIEPGALDFLPGKTELYRGLDELSLILERLPSQFAMEYSQEIPKISFIDGGSIDFLRSLGKEIVSSKTISQKFTSVLSGEQIESHLEAASVLDQVVKEAFDFVRVSQEVYEGHVQRFILDRFEDLGCSTNYPPIVARGENSANPHYSPTGKGSLIRKDDFLLIDLWCKKKGAHTIYADISRVGALAPQEEKIERAFLAVKEAQKRAVEYIKKTKEPRGCDVDTHVRDYLVSLGFGSAIYHRLGHSIDEELHGSGANLDSFETFDDRRLLPNTCYSVEPALYFPGEFGVRLEFDILYFGPHAVEITGGVQEKLLLS